MLSRFYLIPERNGWTDGQTDRRTDRRTDIFAKSISRVSMPRHATLQGAVAWRNQCHDRATLQGVRIPSAILKIVFCHILFFVLFLMQFRL